MKAEEWRERVREAAEKAGTYRPFFDDIIQTLSEILEARDRAREQFEQTGSNPVITHTNKAKEKNLVKNPCLVMMTELNQSALAYWRDLGLTPSGLKKINEEAMKQPQKNTLADILKELG